MRLHSVSDKSVTRFYRSPSAAKPHDAPAATLSRRELQRIVADMIG